MQGGLLLRKPGMYSCQRVLVVRESALGRILTPVCLDFLQNQTLKNLAGHLFFVPAMTPDTNQFKERAKDLATEFGAATFVCNADINENKDLRIRTHLPIKDSAQAEDLSEQVDSTTDLFIINVSFSMK